MKETKQRTKSFKTLRISGLFKAWLVLFSLMICLLGQTAEAKDGTWAGKGTAEEPYLIQDVADLQALQARVNGGDSCKDVYFLLVNNLDLSEVCGENIGSWVPIGNKNHSFEGSFSGELKEISGLYINENEGETIGLFGVNEGQIERLSVSGSVSGKDFVGGIAGENLGRIQGCSSSVSVSGNDTVGGIAGYNGGQINNCYNGGSVTGADQVGGIAGESGDDITFCTNAANISGDKYVGGIAGISNAEIQDCLNNGGYTVEAAGNCAGGIAGCASASIERCTNKAKVLTGTDVAGGIAGLCNEADISFCVNEGDVNGGKDRSGGIVGECHGNNNGVDCNISYCTNNGTVSGVNSYVGGIVGDGLYCSLKECINRGVVAGSGYVGGIAGQFKNYGSLDYATNHGTVTGTTSTGGIVGSSDNSGDIKNCFNDGTVSGKIMSGGIAGMVVLSVKQQDGSYEINNIADCTNEGKITGSDKVGGISGLCEANVLGCVNKGTISAESDVSGGSNVGGIVGVMQSEKNCVENCVNIGNIEGEQNVGGIVGSGSAVYILRCRNEGSIEGTLKNVGGIIGLNTVPEGMNQGEIKQCRNEGEISNSGSNTGGIIGRAANIGILECENTETISAKLDKIGGIIGYGLNVTVKKCGNTGYIRSEDLGVGGIVGYAIETGISDSYNRGSVYGEDRVGGLVGIFNEDNYLTRCYVKASGNGIDCERENGNVGGFYGAILVASWLEFEDCYWWPRCANRALGSNRTDAADYSGEGYGYYRIEDMFEEESNFRNWDFHKVWVIYGNVPELRNNYDISPAGGRGADEENSGSGGTGYQTPHLARIYNLEDFKAFRDTVNDGYNYQSETVYLCADLDLSGDSDLYWEPIGTESHPFDGYFYGGNHIIKGLSVSTSEYGGLFGRCRGNIRDLTVYGRVNSSGRYVGGIVGNCAGAIDNCFFFGNVYCMHGYDGYVGGVVGLLSGRGRINESGHAGYVSTLKGYAGGIVGSQNDKDSEIYYCFHYGPADSVVCPSGYTGTITGEARNPHAIAECYTSIGSAGRFVGRNWDSSQSNVDSCGMLDVESFREPESFSGWDVGYDANHHWVMGADHPLPRSMSDYITLSYNDGTEEEQTVWGIRGNMVLGDIELIWDGHLLNGWNDEPDGSGVSYAAGDEVPAQTTLYAQWIEGYEYHGYIPFEPENARDRGVSGQTYDMLLDGDVNTKWGVAVPADGGSWSLEFATKDYVRVSGYCLVTGDNTEMYSGFNPKGWKLEGKSRDERWVVLDEVTDDETLPAKNQARVYKKLDNTYDYCDFRITFTGVKSGNVFQLSEFSLLYKDPDKDVRKPRITLHPNTIPSIVDKVAKTGDNRSTITLGGDPYNQEAYTLLSWNTDPRGIGDTYEADDPYVIKRDAIVYAMWEPKVFELIINLDSFEGSPVYRRIAYKTTTEFRLTPPEREGYIFKYWIVTNGDGTWKLNEKYDAGTNIYGTYGNVTLAGCWEKRKKVEVSWFSDDNLIGTDTFYEGDIPEYKGEKPEKKSGKEYDYTFIGWDKEFKQLTEDTTFNAVFEETRRSYEITWLDEDGSQFDVTSVEYGTVPSHEPPEKLSTKEKCYIFDGWEETPVAVTGNATYKASFREIPRPYEITWQYEDGSVIDVTEVGYGIVPSHEVPKKQATDEYTYTFIGWGKELSAVDGPAVYTAQFTASKNSYEITWKNENGEVIDVTTVEYGEIPQHEALFKKADPQFEYTFTGWSPSLKAVTGAAEYTAQFSKTVNSHEIVWKDENGNIIDTTTVEYGSMPMHPDLNNKETKEFFYEFEGWEPELKEVTGPAEYQAKFLETRKSYEIIWKYENGLVIDAKTWEYGTVPSCEDPEMEATPEFNYVFAGWDPEVTEVDGPAVYTAKFKTTRRSYEITWKDDEGNVLDTTCVEYGTVPTHKDPKKEATAEFTYTFKGWDHDLKAVTGPDTYVAKFEKKKNSYKITWKNENGEVIDTTTVEYGKIPQHEAPTKASDPQFEYTFSGWSPSIKAVTGDAEYTAQFSETLNSYEIVWKDENGNKIESTIVEYDSMPVHADLTKEETAEFTFEFEGWDPEIQKVSGPAEYQAKFKAIRRSYAVTWQYEDGRVIGTKMWEYGTVPTCDDPTMDATPEYEYVFASWDQKVTAVGGPAVYTAKFNSIRRSYEITWKDDAGNVYDTTTVEYGTVPTHTDPVKEATAEFTYTFKGWNHELTAVTGAETYVAVFEKTKNSYEITWKSDDGSVIDVTTVEYGTMPTHADAQKLSTVEYTYTFAGWDTEVTAAEGPATYTAVFTETKNVYTISFETNEGSEVEAKKAEYGDRVTKPNDPKRNRYVFKGWFADKDLSVPYTFEEPVIADATVYAKWEKEIQPIPELTDGQKPVAKKDLKENGSEQDLVTAPEDIPEGYTILYSIDGGETWSDRAVGTRSGEYTVKVMYKADSEHVDFYGDTLKVVIRGDYYDDGSDREWTKESNNSATIRIKKRYDDADCFANFEKAVVDGENAIKGTDYTFTKGGVVLAFTPTYLETLSVGDHTINVVFKDGECAVTLRIIKKIKEEVPTVPPTEPPTEAPTEAPTEPTTEAPTEPTTEAPTEAPTEPTTEAPTEPTTEAPTEASTEAPTEEPETTIAPTEPTTEAPTEAPTTAPENTPDDDNSDLLILWIAAILAGMVLLAMTILGVISFRKKHIR